MPETEQCRQLPDWLPQYRRLRREFGVKLPKEALESLITDPTAQKFLANWVSFEKNRLTIASDYPNQYVAVVAGEIIDSDPFSITTLMSNIEKSEADYFNRPYITSTTYLY